MSITRGWNIIRSGYCFGNFFYIEVKIKIAMHICGFVIPSRCMNAAPPEYRPPNPNCVTKYRFINSFIQINHISFWKLSRFMIHKQGHRGFGRTWCQGWWPHLHSRVWQGAPDAWRSLWSFSPGIRVPDFYRSKRKLSCKAKYRRIQFETQPRFPPPKYLFNRFTMIHWTEMWEPGFCLRKRVWVGQGGGFS